MPKAARCSGGTEPCVISAGCSMRLSTPPRFSARAKRCVFSRKRRAPVRSVDNRHAAERVEVRGVGADFDQNIRFVQDADDADVYFVSREREGILMEQGAGGAPDLVIEVLSPSTLRLDREKKKPVYLRAGVREVWFVVPEKRQVEIHSSTEEEVVRTLSVGEALTTAVLPGWSVRLDELFD